MDDIVKYLHSHQWLYQDPLISFNQQKLWDQVPNSWQQSILGSTKEQILKFEFMHGDILNFIEGSRALTMPRDLKFIDILDKVEGNLNAFKNDRALRIGMKVKKQHEVENLLLLLGHLCRDRQLNQVVDIGSGKGYISQAVQHLLGYDVIGVEGSEDQHQKAKARAEKTQHRVGKKYLDIDYHHESQFYPIHFHIDYDVDSQQFDDVMKHTRTSDDQRVCMMSLHACGDLSPMILNLFSHWDRANVLVNVGCCYQKIQVHNDSSLGFPLSNAVKGLIQKYELKPLNYFLEVSTYLSAEWDSLDQEGLDSRLKKISYRSHLDEILHNVVSPMIKEKYECSSMTYHVQKMKSASKFKDIQTYISSALERVKLTLNFADGKPSTKLLLKDTEDWSSLKDYLYIEAINSYKDSDLTCICGFMALQLLLAPVAESLVMLDRYYYLKEQNVKAYLIPIFDLELSPRNIAIVGIK